MSLAVDQILQNRYRVVSLLGRGGMGAVYRAWDTRLEVAVAIKEMVPQPNIDPTMLHQFRQQFQQEAQVLARLHHPHLVRVTDFFAEGGNTYLVMDFVAGENLAARIGKKGALPEADVLRWAGQLLDALAYCHAEGVLHRDIKPLNVIITPAEQAVLVDFGLVKLWDPRDPRTWTVVQGMATPEYAPPEQYDVWKGHTDPRSDVYSLGATLYHAMSGQAPPTATERTAHPRRFLPPRSLNPRISARTETAVLRAMALPMEERYATVQEMTAALQEKDPPTRQRSFPDKAPPAAKPVVPTTSRPSWRQPLWIGIGVVLLLALLALVGAAAGGLFAPSSQAPTPTTTRTLLVIPRAPTVTPTPTRKTTATLSPTLTSPPSPTARPTSTSRATFTPVVLPTQARTARPPTAVQPTMVPPSPTPAPTTLEPTERPPRDTVPTVPTETPIPTVPTKTPPRTEYPMPTKPRCHIPPVLDAPPG